MFDSLAQSIYFAPRGRRRLMLLGKNLAQQYLKDNDKIIGLIGDEGSGKSLLIRGMFPGLNLVNDDKGININPSSIVHEARENNFTSHTYHIDVRFEIAFMQPWQLGDVIQKAVNAGRRVVIEHFELLADHLEVEADLLVGIGEEVLTTRPGVFGPHPKEIADIVFKSIKYRRMAHTAEDLTSKILEEEMGVEKSTYHSDVKSGFVLQFEEKPESEFDFDDLEARLKEIIAANKTVKFHDREHIKIGDEIYSCGGPKIHVKKTGDIKNFRLIKELKYDPKAERYLLAGLVGEERSQFKLSNK
ncbi:alanine-tRNA synthetase second additional domain-containing protein [Sporohalobacter salinus]|uniref:alanine-tRNA synthetase second additional domain-containing protein n=1 Tax=Sporohalobacter salinus TaxID=1494606 RepID=UPI0019603C44|nr:alanine-tRNA synthetase second additional domain-containing protein [Sporohalobacter salinus]MBM7624848.1 tRNA A37 threonylcarbamoyladenosine biosynthesis protein TsaE [Sporohalobacter salinus]